VAVEPSVMKVFTLVSLYITIGQEKTFMDYSQVSIVMIAMRVMMVTNIHIVKTNIMTLLIVGKEWTMIIKEKGAIIRIYRLEIAFNPETEEIEYLLETVEDENIIEREHINIDDDTLPMFNLLPEDMKEFMEYLKDSPYIIGLA